MYVQLNVKFDYIGTSTFKDVDEVGVKTVGIYADSYKLTFRESEDGIQVSKRYPKKYYELGCVCEEREDRP